MSNPGPPPLNGDENRQGGMLATVLFLTVIACTAVALRMGTRIWIVRSVGWDDYTMVLAVFGTIIGTGLVVVQIHYGLGRHKYYLTEWEYIEFKKYSYGEWIQTFQTLMFTKVSICIFLLRIPVEKIYIRPLQGTIVCLIISNIILTLLWIFQCNPISSSWRTQIPRKCFTNAQLSRIIISQALISIISDFLLALFPIVLLWKVQIALRVKAGLCGLMGLGLITAGCCIVRTVLNWQNENADPTWVSVDNWYWRSWEVCIGITAACIPALRPGYKIMTAAITSYMSHRSQRKTSGITLVNTSGPSNNQAHNTEQNEDQAFQAAVQASSAEADLSKYHGAGEEGFAMNNLPGDKETMDEGIRKFTRIDIASTKADERQRSLELGDPDRSLGNRDFV